MGFLKKFKHKHGNLVRLLTAIFLSTACLYGPGVSQRDVRLSRSVSLRQRLNPSGERIAIIAVHVISNGNSLPRWANYWAQSCGGNSEKADCILIMVVDDATDSGDSPESNLDLCQSHGNLWNNHWARVSSVMPQNEAAAMFMGREASDLLPDNVIVVKMGPAEVLRRFAHIAGRKTENATIVIQPRKMADYRPLFGDLFEDLISSPCWHYTHWAWTDLDVIYGNLLAFTSLNVSVDIQPLYFIDPEAWVEPTTSGQFTLFQNRRLINRLWENVPGVFEILRDWRQHSFDETLFGAFVFSLPHVKIRTSRVTAMDMGACNCFGNRRDYDVFFEQQTDIWGRVRDRSYLSEKGSG
jgi:hypothetical protein